MSRFFIGQRVKVARVRHANKSHFIGLEGRITDRHVPKGRYDNSFPDGYAYTVDGIDLGYEEVNGRLAKMYFSSFNLEPILPDGHRPGSWEGLEDLYDAITEHAHV